MTTEERQILAIDLGKQDQPWSPCIVCGAVTVWLHANCYKPLCHTVDEAHRTHNFVLCGDYLQGDMFYRERLR